MFDFFTAELHFGAALPMQVLGLKGNYSIGHVSETIDQGLRCHG
jgi:hypothetical protein